MRDYTTLQVVWFVLLSVLWIGYFVLEGFDFGVGMLLRRLGHGNAQRRAMLHTIGPVWDGNEVWLIVAGAGTFAAFPEWYATLFSGFYLALVLILAALIVRGVAFEFWGKHDSPRWRSAWEWGVVVGSAAPALLWGVAWANIVGGSPIDRNHEFTGDLLDLLGPYALLGGVTTLALFYSHGAIFLALRLRGDMIERARAAARTAAPVAAVLVTAFLAWTIARKSDRDGIDVASLVCAIGAVAAVAAVPTQVARSPGRAFALSAAGIALLFAALLVDLFPHVMISSTSPAFDMTLDAAASTSYTLSVMTVVAAILLPVVLVYVAWSYWVFRHRVGPEDFEDVKTPLDLIDKHRAPAEG
jgi:cytochrome d ubiquinol oxidase subunit II